MDRPDALVKEMLAAMWNVHGEVFGLPNLREDFSSFESALELVANRVAEGGRVLFVGTTPAAKDAVALAANRSDQYFVDTWSDETLESFRSHYNNLVMIIVDPEHEAPAAREARKVGIPVVGVAAKKKARNVDYVLRGDPAAEQTITVICNLVANAALFGIGAKTHQSPPNLPIQFADKAPGSEGLWGSLRFTISPAEKPSLLVRKVWAGLNHFSASDELVDLVYRALLSHYEILVQSSKQQGPAPNRDQAKALVTDRILELIAAWARRMRYGTLPQKPVLTQRGFDYQFVSELSENIPVRIDDGTFFFRRLQDELVDFLSLGGKIEGEWGRLVLVGSRIEFQLTKLSAPIESKWQKPERIEWR